MRLGLVFRSNDVICLHVSQTLEGEKAKIYPKMDRKPCSPWGHATWAMFVNMAHSHTRVHGLGLI